MIGGRAHHCLVIDPIGVVPEVVALARSRLGRRTHAGFRREPLLAAIVIVPQLGGRGVADPRHELRVLQERAVAGQFGVLDRVREAARPEAQIEPKDE